uniref:Xrn1 N-terminal domain-containing protein n=2 Tax=Rhodosorus marinus TaxID=101924 RepID=A0A7S2ZRU4_9RHOD|mmetsp:Transcript_3044/g.14373  ORF Transcript_3044/g.14373 Transcript_3044/m.14373 type:complete len:536 (+) Transcript_3044:368-1975(+)
MGITGFQKWIRTTFPEAVDDVPKRAEDRFDYVCIDMNHVLHSVANRSPDHRRIPLLLFAELDRLLKVCQPLRAVVLAMDGPAPLAKVATARKRREQYVSRKQYNSSSGHDYYLEFTPGTAMMHQLSNAIEYFICQRLLNRSKFGKIDFIFSGSNVHGEGEIKILDYLNLCVAPKKENSSVVIIGGDSDIILQALCTPQIYNFFVFVRSGGPTSCVSVRLLGSLIDELLGDNQRLDFVLLCLLSGNDYLPKLRGYNLSKAMKKYSRIRRRTKQSVIGGPPLGINWETFCQVIDKHNRMAKMAKASRSSSSVNAFPSAQEEDGEDLDGVDDDELEDDAVLTGDYDVETYIKGLLWNMQMYIDGYPPDQLFYYRFKYAPPVDAVLDFFLEKGMYTQVDLPVSNRPAITSQLALTLMLPSAAWSLAPGRLQPLVKSGASISDFVEVRKRVQEIPFSTYTGEERTMLRTGVVWRYRKGSEPEPFTRPPPPMHWECCKALPPGKTNRNPFEVINSPSLRTYSDAREEKTVKLAFGDRLVRF